MVEVSARGNGRECIPATCPLKKKAATYEPVSKKPAPLPCTERKNLHQREYFLCVMNVSFPVRYMYACHRRCWY